MKKGSEKKNLSPIFWAELKPWANLQLKNKENF